MRQRWRAASISRQYVVDYDCRKTSFNRRDTHRDVASIAVQHPALLAVLARDPLLAPALLLLLGDEPVDRPLLGVDDDLIAVLNEGDRSADERLGNDVACDSPTISTGLGGL